MATSTPSKNYANSRPGETREANQGGDMSPAQDLMDYFRDYAKAKPEVVALWCLGIGFVLGWKLKPW